MCVISVWRVGACVSKRDKGKSADAGPSRGTIHDLKTMAFHNAYSNSNDSNNRQDMNEILGNVEGANPFYQSYSTSKTLNL